MASASNFIQIKNYRLDFPHIGKGAFGIVYRGRDNDTGQTIAAKNVQYKEQTETLNEDNEELFKMNKKEGEILQKLNGHKNIVKLIDFFDADSCHWFIMEFCELGDLPKYMKTQAVNLHDKIKIMVDVSSGLSFMHSMKPPVIHRDIKPENVLMKLEDGGHRAKLSDFELGKLFEADTSHFTMMSGVGTWGFMAPEFYIDTGYVQYQPGVDTFALGLLYSVVLLYDKKRHSDMTPMSVKTRSSGGYIHYGLEMKNAHKNKTPMPQLFEEGAERNPCVAKLKGITVEMTQFHDKDRPTLQQVKTQVLESYYELIQFQNISAELADLKIVHGNLQRDYDTLQCVFDTFKREHDTLQKNHDALQTDFDDAQRKKVDQREVGDTVEQRGIVKLPEISQIDQCTITCYTVDQVQGIKQTYSNAIIELLDQDLKAKENIEVLQKNYEQAIKQIQNLRIVNDDLCVRLSEEMSEKVSTDEIIISKHGPVKVADEYQEFSTDEWLELKQCLDESFPKESEMKKLKLLTDILMACYENAQLLNQNTTTGLCGQAQGVQSPQNMRSTEGNSIALVLKHQKINNPQFEAGKQQTTEGRRIIMMPVIHQIDKCAITYYTEDQVLSIKQSYSSAIHKLLDQDQKSKEANELLQTDFQRAMEQIQYLKRTNKDLPNRLAILKRIKKLVTLQESGEKPEEITSLVQAIFQSDVILESLNRAPQMQQYVTACAWLCLKMLLQVPAMTFNVSGVRQAFQPDTQEPVWESADPKDSRSVVAAYTHPALYQGQKLMVKGKVLLQFKK